MSHIIYHAYYSKHHNQPAYCIHNVKTSYMLDFHKFFRHPDKRRKNAENEQKMRKNTRKTQKIMRKTAESQNFFADAVRCGWHPRRRGAAWTAISKCRRSAVQTRTICSPLESGPIKDITTVKDTMKEMVEMARWRIVQ